LWQRVRSWLRGLLWLRVRLWLRVLLRAASDVNTREGRCWRPVLCGRPGGVLRGISDRGSLRLMGTFCMPLRLLTPGLVRGCGLIWVWPCCPATCPLPVEHWLLRLLLCCCAVVHLRCSQILGRLLLR